MVSVVFTAASGSVTVDGHIVYESEYDIERLNQYSLLLPDGTDLVYDNGINKVYGTLVIKGVSKEQGLAFESWVREKIVWQLHGFTISAVADFNLGNGFGFGATNVRYDGGTKMSKILKYISPGEYELRFPYKFVGA